MPAQQIPASALLQSGTGSPLTNVNTPTGVDSGLYIDTLTGTLWYWDPTGGGAGTGTWVSGFKGAASQKQIYGTGINIISATARDVRYVHRGDDMKLAEVSGAISIALTVGDATVTFTINGGAALMVLTCVQAGSAPGDIFNASFPADTIITDGDVLEMAIGGGNTAAAVLDLTIQGDAA